MFSWFCSRRTETRVSVELAAGEGSLPESQTAAFSLRLHVAFPWGGHIPGGSSSLYKDTGPPYELA